MGVVRDPRGVTLSNWQDPPFNRWAFSHLEELLDMDAISRGNGEVWELAREERDLRALSFAIGDRSWTIGEMLDATFTDGFMVLRDGQVITEWYADGLTSDTLHLTMSITKSLTSALAGVLVGRGLVDPDAPVTGYVEELRGTSFDGCSVQHLLDMRAGTKWDEDYSHFFDSDAFVYEQVMGWRPRTSPHLPPNMFSYMEDLKDNDRPHGGQFEYRSILTDVLGWVLERAGGSSFAQLFSKNIWSAMGAEQDALITIDPGGCAITDGGMCTTLRDLARFGQLYVENGRDIVPRAWVHRLGRSDPELVRAFSIVPEASLYPGAMYHDCWWVLAPDRGISVGLGIYGQMLLIHRSAGAVIVKFSTQPRAIDLESDFLQITGSIAICDALASGGM